MYINSGFLKSNLGSISFMVFEKKIHLFLNIFAHWVLLNLLLQWRPSLISEQHSKPKKEIFHIRLLSNSSLVEIFKTNITYSVCPVLNFILQSWPSWIPDPYKNVKFLQEHPNHASFQMVLWFQRMRFKKNFPCMISCYNTVQSCKLRVPIKVSGFS